jgi:hypothetical protein
MKLSLYIETSVIGAYLDNGDTYRRDLTIRWFEHELREYRVFTSQLTMRELDRFEDPYRSSYLAIASGFETLGVAGRGLDAGRRLCGPWDLSAQVHG